GPTWLTATDSAGSRRLEDQADFVRREIESALRLGKRVVPVLVRGAEMPRADDLPVSLRSLTRQHAIVLRREYLEADTRAVIKAVTGQGILAATYDAAVAAIYDHVAAVLTITIYTTAVLILGLFGWKITKRIPDIVDFANALLSDRAQVDRLLN